MLCTSYDFYKGRLNEINNKLTMEKVLGKILGQKVVLKIITNKEAGITDKQPTTNDQQQGKNNSLLQSALEILGGKVVEEE